MSLSIGFSSLTKHFAESAKSWRSIADDLSGTLAKLDDIAFIREKVATRFILSWMRELKKCQDSFSSLIRRKKRPPVADDFTAAVAFTLEQFLASRGLPGTVRCEETTKRKRGATRPDISIRSPIGNLLISTIECKTDFGWKRNTWKEAFKERTQKLHEEFPDCVSYLCVLCHEKWDIIEKEWYCLSRLYPTRLADPITDSDILTPIEPMFVDILAVTRASFISDIEKLPEAEKEKLRRSLESHR